MCIYVGITVPVEVRGQLPPCGSWGLNSSHQACWQASLPADPSLPVPKLSLGLTLMEDYFFVTVFGRVGDLASAL